VVEELDGSKVAELRLYSSEESGTAPDRSRSLDASRNPHQSGALLYTAAFSLGLLASLSQQP